MGDVTHAMYGLVFKKQGLQAFGWPVLFFLVLSAGALYCALFYTSLVLGFAVGLTAPLGLGAFIAYDAATRLTTAANKAT